MTSNDKALPKTDMVDAIVDAFSAECPDVDLVLLELVSRLIVAGRELEADGAQALSGLEGHYTDFDVLGMLRTNGAPYEMTPAQLMDRVMLTSGAMTACLGRMARSGLVERRTDQDDRRIKHVRLTKKGQALADESIARRFQISEERFADLSLTDKQHLITLLRQLSAERPASR